MNSLNITPQNDALFKMIFADPKHERVLVHFLNCAISSKDRIKEVTVLNNEITKQHVEDKGSRLDILAKTNSGELIDIEMQVGADQDMVGRTLFYWSKLFSGQLIVGKEYHELRRTISINILNFKLFKQDERYWRKCHVADGQTHEKITDLLEIQFLELNKMKQFDKESPITFWIEFFKNPYSEACNELYKVVPELREAKEMFEQAKADPEKRRLLEEREDAKRNYASAISSAERRGEERGKKREAEKIAKELLETDLTIEQIAKATKLTIKEIKAIKNETV